METRTVRGAIALALLVGLGGATGEIACGGGSSGGGPGSDGGTVDGALAVDGGEGDAMDDGGGCAVDVSPSAGLLATSYGAVRGALDGTVYAYKNIPFAAPPVGELRWTLPRAPACWTGERDGTAWGPSCMQGDSMGQGIATGVEDCLQLNVWSPKDAKGRPILFWIHGGGNQIGSAVDEAGGLRTYDGKNLAEATGAVVVTTNYRLGLLGFFGHAALVDEAKQGAGNQGLHDIAFALAWTRKHAERIGGDPANITILGESAGGLNVCSLIASKNGAGTFAAAIIESGGCAARTLADAEDQAKQIATAAKCDGAADVLACLRALPGPDLLKAFPTSVLVAGKSNGFGATMDGVFIDAKPLDVIKAGNHAKVPVILGSNANETSRTVPLKPAATDAEYQAAVGVLFAGLAPQILAQYPSSAYPSPWAAYVALTSEAKFICPTRANARALASAGSPTWRYFFDHPLDNAPLAKAFGTYHGLDVPFVFGHLEVAGYVPSDAEKQISRAFMGYWGSLASSKDPSALSSLAPWPKYDPVKDNALGIGTTTAVREKILAANCDFWDALFP